MVQRAAAAALPRGSRAEGSVGFVGIAELWRLRAAMAAVSTSSAQSDKPLLHICYAPADHAWVHGRMVRDFSGEAVVDHARDLAGARRVRAVCAEAACAVRARDRVIRGTPARDRSGRERNVDRDHVGRRARDPHARGEQRTARRNRACRPRAAASSRPACRSSHSCARARGTATTHLARISARPRSGARRSMPHRCRGRCSGAQPPWGGISCIYLQPDGSLVPFTASSGSGRRSAHRFAAKLRRRALPLIDAEIATCPEDLSDAQRSSW